MELSQAYKEIPFARAGRTRAGFGHPQGVTNLKSFFRWVKRNDPGFYNEVRKAAPHLLTVDGRAMESGEPVNEFLGETPNIHAYDYGDESLGADDVSNGPGLKTAAIIEANKPPVTSWADKLINIASAVIPIWQQREVMKLQIKRAEKGLPPVDVSQITTPGVRIEMAPEIQREIIATTRAGKLAIPIGIGIFALMFFMGGKR